MMKKFIGIKKTMEFNWYLRFTSAGFIKIATFSFLQLLNFSFESWPYIISSSFAILGCLIVFLFPIYLILLLRRNDIKDKNFIRKFGGVF